MKRVFYYLAPIILFPGLIFAELSHPGTRISGNYSGGWGKNLRIEGQYSGAIGDRAEILGANTYASLCVGRGSVSAPYSVLFGDAITDQLTTAHTLELH